jgi:AraC family transcriptional regulator of adaptative response/methylated-DNA-[protein]-cysteine methyltransferase
MRFLCAKAQRLREELRMAKLTQKEMLAATRRNDAAYDGKFWVGVKSTGIYCLPSCRAKLPLVKNIIFFADRHEAVVAGFRGCKRCKSEFFPDVAPNWLRDVLSFMKKEVNHKINENTLAQLANVDISTIRRYFKTHLHSTPLAYHRKLRLAHARKMIEQGEDYLTAAYECGFESASGFRDAFVREYGLPPGEYYASRSNRLQRVAKSPGQIAGRRHG